jgi:hypothetical protein
MDDHDGASLCHESMGPRFERALEQAMNASDETSLEQATRTLGALGRELAERLALLAPVLRRTAQGRDRQDVVDEIRRLVSGRDAA